MAIPLKESVLAIPPWQYVAYAFLLSAVVRALLVFFRAFRVVHESDEGVSEFVRYFGRLLVGLSHSGVARRSPQRQIAHNHLREAYEAIAPTKQLVGRSRVPCCHTRREPGSTCTNLQAGQRTNR